MNRWRVCGFAAALTVAGVAINSGVASAESLHNLPVGTIVSGVAELGDRQVYLPPGPWKLEAKGESRAAGTDTGGIQSATIFLSQIEGGVLKRHILASTNLQAYAGGWGRSTTICDRTDSFFNKSDRNYSPNDTECFNVNSISLNLVNNASQVAQEF